MEGVNQAPVSMASANSKEEREAALFRSLPSGYRFKPRDEELVEFYLKRKIQNKELPPNIIRDVELYNYDPETLTAMNNNASSNGVVTEWFFFTPRERKYANGMRPRRCAGHGFWKASGKDKEVFFEGEKVGLKKTLVYYRGKPPRGDKTDWTMHEYVLVKAPARQRLGKEDMRLDDWVLCRIYKKLAKSQRSSGKGAIVVHSEGEVEENGNLPLAQNEEFHADVSNMPMSQPTSVSNMLPQYSEPLYPIMGHDHASLMPLSRVGPGNRPHLPPMQQHQFLNVCPSNRSHLPPMQQQPFDALPEQNPGIFSNSIPTHVQWPPLPLNQQSWSQVLLQQPFSHVGPSNLPQLPPTQQPRQISDDKATDFDSIFDDMFLDDFDPSAFSPIEL